MHDSPPRLAASPAKAGVSFAELKSLEAQLALYRGFLHEVNNALAGIGSLAEVLKDSEGPVLAKNLDLIIHAAGKSGMLQRRIRALYSESKETIDVDLPAFMAENRDLMELMLPREQRFMFENSSRIRVVQTSIDSLWNLISLAILWAAESQTKKILASFIEDRTLKFVLSSGPLKAVDEQWAEAFAEIGKAADAEVFIRESETIFRFH